VNYRRILLIALAVLALPGSAEAQETRANELPSLDDDVGVLDRMKLRLTLANRFVGSAKFGDFDTTSNQPEGRLRLELPVARRTLLRVMATGRALLYDFDGPTTTFADGDEPFDDLYSTGLRLQAAHLLPEGLTLFSDDERWAMVAQAGTRSSWEGGSKFVDGLRGGGSLAVGYRLGDRLEVVAGVSLASRLTKRGVAVGPLLEFDWRINEAWKLKSYGLGLQLERRLGERFTIFGRARLENSRYRLADRGGDVGKGTLSVRQLPAGLGVDWRIARALRIRLLAGAIAVHRLRLRDDDGQRVGSISADGASPYVSLRIDLRH